MPRIRQLARPAVSLLFIAILSLVTPPASAADAVLIYVAPGGDDAGAGTLEKPFRTPARARDAVRELKKRNGGKLAAPATVQLRGGTYALAEPLVLTPEDSGTADAPVTYAAHADEKPVISGGRAVTGWVKRDTRAGPVWEAKLSSPMPGAGPFRSLWVNGGRRTRARHPDKGKGLLKVAEVPGATAEWTAGQKEFRFKEGDIPATLPTGAEVVMTSRWVESRLPVTKVDAAQRLVHFDRKSVFVTQPDDRYWIEGAAEFLTEPGEWHYDRQASVLHYRPMPNESPENARAFVPALPQVLLIRGDPASGKFVEHVTFRGVAFSHTEWGHDSPGADNTRSGFSQAAVGVPAAVHAVGAKTCAFDRCTFSNLGTYALHLAGGCANNRVTHCTITDLGAGGVRIGETSLATDDARKTRHNELSDCTITDGGRLFPSAIGVWIGQSSDNRVAHNEIANFYYTGISVGWTWGYGPSLAKGNIIEHNHVHHIGHLGGEPEPILSDMAGIYTLGIQPGTVIRHNRFHDIAAVKYGGWGIYFDEGSSEILAENNLVYRTTHGGFHQHYGKDNVFRNNVIAFGRDAQVQRTRSEAHRSFTFERNIVYWAAGNPLTGNWDNRNVAFDRNVYWRVDGKTDFLFAGMTFDQWRQQGMDANSRIIDPGFANAAAGDFALRPGSPSAGVGFVPFDLKDVGPRPVTAAAP